MRMIWILVLALSLSPPVAFGCGIDTDCAFGDRTYRIALPEGAPKGALIHAHGYRGTAQGVIRNRSLREAANGLDLALIAPKSKGDDWNIPGVPANMRTDGAEEFEYFDALIELAVTQHGIPRERIFVSGFSAGGMMVWNLACHRGSAFAAFIPIAGTFWDPVPEVCPDLGTHMVHIHGLADKIVPLAGRPIGPTRQGDVPKALRLFAGTGTPDNERRLTPDLTCVDYDMRRSKRSLHFCTHPGGHSIRASYLRTAFMLLREQGVF